MTERTPHDAPLDDAELDRLLAGMTDEPVPLGDAFRRTLIADVPRPVAAPAGPGWRSWLGPLAAGLPAAVAGVWIGMAQPGLMLDLVPLGATESQAATLDDVFGTWQEDI